MKKNVFLAAALLALMAAVLPAQTDSEGTPGLKFTLPKGGTGYSVDKGKVKTGAVVIPESYNNMPVTAIAKKAFSSSTITSITIPNSVTDIGDGAFKSCKNLTEITIPNSVTTLGKEAFDGCKGLTSITIGNGVTSIGEEAFDDCVGLTGVTIPDSVTSIGEQAFRGCTSLAGITIGKSVTSIGKQAFKGCKSLTGVIIPDGVTSIESGTFDGCTSLTSVTIGNGVTNIKGGAVFGGGAFNGCTSLTSVTIPNNVTTIGNAAFSNTGLTSVTIPSSVINSELNAFANCKNLTAINVDAANPAYSSDNGVWYNKNKTVLLRCPQGKTGAYTILNGVTSIGTDAFSLCGNLTSITIPNSVTTIKRNAFSSSGLTSITIPNSVTTIEEYVFTGCPKLTSITFQGPLPKYIKLGDDYNLYSPFPDDLHERFLAGGAGTYIKDSTIYMKGDGKRDTSKAIWSKQ